MGFFDRKPDIERILPGERLFTVRGTQTLSVSVNVRLTVDRLKAIAQYMGVEVADLTLDDLTEALLDVAYDQFPSSICAQDTGCGQTTDDGLKWSRDDNEDDIFDGSEFDNIEDQITEITKESENDAS